MAHNIYSRVNASHAADKTRNEHPKLDKKKPRGEKYITSYNDNNDNNNNNNAMRQYSRDATPHAIAEPDVGAGDAM